MNQVLRFWYGQSPNWVYARFIQTIQILDGHLAIRETARHLSEPIFQDYTLQGRFIGVILRLLRILFAFVFYCLVAMVYTLGYGLWLLLPFLCLVSLVGAFIA